MPTSILVSPRGRRALVSHERAAGPLSVEAGYTIAAIGDGLSAPGRVLRGAVPGPDRRADPGARPGGRLRSLGAQLAQVVQLVDQPRYVVRVGRREPLLQLEVGGGADGATLAGPVRHAIEVVGADADDAPAAERGEQRPHGRHQARDVVVVVARPRLAAGRVAAGLPGFGRPRALHHRRQRGRWDVLVHEALLGQARS